MQNETDGTMRSPTLRHLSRREDFIESRRITFWLLSQALSFPTALLSRKLEKVLARLSGVMGYSVNARYPIDATTMIQELIFTSLLSVGTSLPAEVMELRIYSRLFNTRVAGIRGAYWIVSTLFDMPALTPSSPQTTNHPTV